MVNFCFLSLKNVTATFFSSWHSYIAHSRDDHHHMSRLLRVGAIDSETLQHTNKRLPINIEPSEPRPPISDKIDVNMVRKKYGYPSEEGSIW